MQMRSSLFHCVRRPWITAHLQPWLRVNLSASGVASSFDMKDYEKRNLPKWICKFEYGSVCFMKRLRQAYTSKISLIRFNFTIHKWTNSTLYYSNSVFVNCECHSSIGSVSNTLEPSALMEITKHDPTIVLVSMIWHCSSQSHSDNKTDLVVAHLVLHWTTRWNLSVCRISDVGITMTVARRHMKTSNSVPSSFVSNLTVIQSQIALPD